MRVCIVVVVAVALIAAVGAADVSDSNKPTASRRRLRRGSTLHKLVKPHVVPRHLLHPDIVPHGWTPEGTPAPAAQKPAAARAPLQPPRVVKVSTESAAKAGPNAAGSSAVVVPTYGPVTKTGERPIVYEVTFMTADGLPAIVNADVKSTDHMINAEELEKRWAAIKVPTVAPPVDPRLAGPKQQINGIDQPLVTRVLKLGAKAADNPCVRMGGQCQAESTCGGTKTKLLCPGPPSIVCCTYANAACSAAGGSCKARSSCDGKFHLEASCGADKEVACCVTADKTSNVAGNCLKNFNPPAFAERARKYLKDYAEQTAKDKQAQEAMVAFGLTARITRTDPASLVTTVLESLGWGCYFNAASGKTVPAMIPVMKAHGGFHPYPKPGDVAMWESSTGIVVAVCVGGQLEVITMSNGSETGVVASTGCTPLEKFKQTVKSPFLGFWTPQ